MLFPGSLDKTEMFELEHHLMEAGKRHTEIAQHVGLGGQLTLETLVSIDEGQILALFLCEAGRQGVSIGS